MKIAIVHDYIKEYGGAERVLEALHELYPQAPVYTTVYLPKFLGPHRERFKNWKIKTSWFQYIPFKGKLISPLRIIAPFLFKSFDFSKFDMVIVSQTGAYTPNSINKNGAIQICYTHTPPRYLYGYATARDWKKNKLMNIVGTLINHILRMVDYKSSQNVDYFIANSENVKKRIQKFYKRDAKVIYPPVDIAFSWETSSVQLNLNAKKLDAKRYFLTGGRIARPKNIELIVKTFEQMKLPLKVFGREFGGLQIHKSSFINHKSNIEFLGEVSDEEKFELMRNAKAYIFASEDEDFGITPVEAQGFGTPVVAYRSGGVLESVIEGKTGIYFDELFVKSLKNAVLRVGSMHFDRALIAKHARKFSKERFQSEIKEFLKSKIRSQKSNLKK